MSIREIWKVTVLTGLVLAVCGCGRPKLIGSDAPVYSRGQLYAIVEQDLNRRTPWNRE